MKPHRQHYDFILIGGGYRGVTFLASNPALTDQQICVVEQNNCFGPGLFGSVDVLTNSAGRDFFCHVNPADRFGWIFQHHVIGPVATSSTPVSTRVLSEALRCLGKAITLDLRRRSALVQEHVTTVDVDANRSAPVVATTNKGLVLHARRCILATGRYEAFDPAFEAFRGQSWLSSEVLSVHYRRELVQRLQSTPNGTISIIGGSHSAFSVAELILKLIGRLSKANSSCQKPQIRLIHRSPIRLFYSSVNEAESDPTVGHAEFDPIQDVCPHTGAVFRYSGLRNSARNLYCAIQRGDVSDIMLHRVEDSSQIVPLLRRSDFVVQAIGYVANVPELRKEGIVFRRRMCTDPLEFDQDGFLSMHDMSTHVAAIHVQPGSRASSGGSAHPEDLYKRLAYRLLNK